MSNANFTTGSDNIFDNLGFDLVEANNLRARANLMISLRRQARDAQLTDVQAASAWQISPQRVKVLMAMLGHAGLRVQMAVVPLAA